jgi:xanthine dehydrogenase small subunit
MNIRPIRLFHRGSIVEIDDVAPESSTRTVLQWLREDRRLIGTKEGCAEGDCGACTVVVGDLDPAGRLRLRPVNACIRFVPTLDGKALFTVEDLAGLAGPGGAAGSLHPVQQAMVDCHGSQCGFCTPGFVMSMWACYERHQAAGSRPTRQQLADDLSGNLCRCTGYRPILDAGEQMFGAPPVRLDPEPVVAALRELAQDPPLATASGFHAPRTLADLSALLSARPQARLVAGATDVGLWVTKRLEPLPELIYTGEVAELGRIEMNGDTLRIGSAVSLESAWRMLVDLWPPLRDMWLRFASLPIRNAGTLGGNLANGSPIGDAAPVLMALDARLVLRRGARQRTVALPAFYIDYMKNALEPGELLEAIEVPLSPARVVRAYKISKRFDSDISAVSAGLAIELDAGDGETIRAARVAFGGMAATVRRAAAAERALAGKPWTEATLEAATAALAQDFKPITDMRASAAYRTQVAGNLLRRFWLETRAQGALPEGAVSVFARVSA